MRNLIGRVGDVAGILGVLVCLVSSLARISGSYYVGTFTATSLFDLGIGLMVFACLAKIHAHMGSHHEP
jgi:hypothetical protein